jgi:hypothetical protein
MAHHTDWMPSSRTGILTMGRVWIEYMTSARRTAWGVPQDQYNELSDLFDTAQELLYKAMDEAERTHVITVQCREAFEALTAKMRFIRDRWFKVPPLSGADWAALGFREPDDHPSPIPRPDGVPAAALSYPGGPHAITAHLGPLPGTQELDPRSDYGYAIYMGIMPPGGATLEQAASKKHYLMAVPKDGEGLLHYRFTRRKKEKIVFEAEDAGMTVYVCCRYENQKGDVGDWGPVTSIVIPG